MKNNHADDEQQVTQLETLVQFLADGILVLDREGIVRFANPAAATLLSKPIDGLIGFQFGFPYISSDKPVEIIIPRPRGKTAIVELCANSIEWQGEEAMLASLREVTAFKQAQEEIREQRNFAESLIETAQTIILLLDTEGHIVSFNPYMEEISGYRLEEVKGKDWVSTFIPGPERDIIRDTFKRAIGDTPTIGNINVILKKDGSEVYIEWHDKTLKDENGETTGLLAVGRDITEEMLAAQELRESQLRYSLAVDGINDGIWDRDLLSNEIYFSPRWKKMLGYEDHEIANIFSEWHTRVHPDDIDRTWQTLNDYLEGKTEKYRLEHRLLHKDGTYRWILSRGVCLRDADGTAIRMVGSHTNITVHKMAEEKLRRNEQFLQSITENMFDLVTMTDIDGRRIYVSPSHERTVGYSPGFLMGRQVTEFIHPEDLPAIVNKLEEANKIFQPGKAVYRYKKADGEYIWLETLGKVILDDDEKLDGMIFSSRDITDRKKAEDSLEEALANSRLRARELEHLLKGAQMIVGGGDFAQVARGIFDGAREMIGARSGYVALLSKDGKENEVLFLESGGLPCAVDPDLPMPIRGLRAEVYQAGRAVYDNDFMNSKWLEFLPDDHVNLQNVIFAPLNVEGEILGIMGLANKPTDFTPQDLRLVESFAQLASIALQKQLTDEDQEHLESQLFQAQKMESVGRLAGGVAHDFNNLLTVIQGYADFVHGSLDKDDPLRKDMEEILQAADSAADLTGQLLAFSRKQVISRKVINFNKAIEQSEKMLSRIIGEDIDLVFVPDENLGHVLIDPGQINQILVNLSVNARDAMPDGGKLTIATKNVTLEHKKTYIRKEDLHGEFIVLTVSDNGMGMSVETQAKIFEPFYTTKPLGKGTGLGLSTVYGIIKQNDGYINVYSKPDHGTTFKIYFPRVNMEEDAPELKGDVKQTSGHEKILLVEDQELVRKLAVRILSKQGYNVIGAADGEEAVYRFEQTSGKIDLLVTDVVMPIMNGKQLYEKLSATSPGLSVLYMSGYTDDAISLHGILEEGTAFIQKPFRKREFALKVREVLDSAAPRKDKQNQRFSTRDTILLIDDEEQFHKLYERYAKDLGMSLLTALNGQKGLKQLRSHADRIALIICDLNLPDCNGADLVERLTDICEDIPVVLASGLIPDDLRQQNFRKGKVVCLQKPTTDVKKWFLHLVEEYSSRS